jgi:4-hydroxy-tetrahydrodipicolinate synthase
MATGMSAVIYCGSMGDWPLLTDAQRMEGVERLVAAGIPVVVGTGAQNPARAAALAAHARSVGARGLMVIPRVLSRGSSVAAQRAHFAGILDAAPELPAVIYNSPYYGFETRADLFFEVRRQHPNLVGFKEFGGAQALTYAAEHITGQSADLILLVGVDTQVFHGYVNCGAVGAITGIGNVLPKEVLHMVRLCEKAAKGDATARRQALELEAALWVLSSFDDLPGTLVCDEDEIVEKQLVSGIAYSRDEAKITLVRVPDKPGVAAAIFGPLADGGINVDMIVQNTSEDGKFTDMTFTVGRAEFERAIHIIERNQSSIGFQKLLTDKGVAKVSVIGVGMRAHAGVAQAMFKTLAEKGINIQVISTSEIKISVLIAAEFTDTAVRALHTTYGLDK